MMDDRSNEPDGIEIVIRDGNVQGWACIMGVHIAQFYDGTSVREARRRAEHGYGLTGDAVRVVDETGSMDDRS